MRLDARLKKLDEALPRCPANSTVARGSHVLYIEEVIVTPREEAELCLAKNGEPA